MFFYDCCFVAANSLFCSHPYYEQEILISRNTHQTDNITQNMSVLPSNLPPDVDGDMKKRVAAEGLELLHNGTGTFNSLIYNVTWNYATLSSIDPKHLLFYFYR